MTNDQLLALARKHGARPLYAMAPEVADDIIFTPAQLAAFHAEVVAGGSSAIPEGWRIVSHGDVIVVQAPDGSGYAAEDRKDIPQSILFRLARALLDAEAIRAKYLGDGE